MNSMELQQETENHFDTFDKNDPNELKAQRIIAIINIELHKISFSSLPPTIERTLNTLDFELIEKIYQVARTSITRDNIELEKLDSFCEETERTMAETVFEEVLSLLKGIDIATRSVEIVKDVKFRELLSQRTSHLQIHQISDERVLTVVSIGEDEHYLGIKEDGNTLESVVHLLNIPLLIGNLSENEKNSLQRIYIQFVRLNLVQSLVRLKYRIKKIYEREASYNRLDHDTVVPEWIRELADSDEHSKLAAELFFEMLTVFREDDAEAMDFAKLAFKNALLKQIIFEGENNLTYQTNIRTYLEVMCDDSMISMAARKRFNREKTMLTFVEIALTNESFNKKLPDWYMTCQEVFKNISVFCSPEESEQKSKYIQILQQCSVSEKDINFITQFSTKTIKIGEKSYTTIVPDTFRRSLLMLVFFRQHQVKEVSFAKQLLMQIFPELVNDVSTLFQ